MKLAKLATASVLIASLAPIAAMADNTGVVKFEGQVVDSPCNIEQSSLNQTVDFGQLSRKALEAGQAAEADFDIKVTGCDLTNFAGNGPVNSMDVTFTGQDYADAGHTLLATSTGNTNNLGVSINGFVFGTSKDVKSSIVNEKGENTLTFKALASAVDVAKPVTEGKFSAVSNFRISYQ
ncbi:type 1 fimbrial protein [Acinetobacter guerrae]|uniref:Type 1 fimbrial protein n=1 Tax=Acinetobacter guerrae TaxID=1843371 RepID=A0A3A8EU75_9GAMM|nr:fimbrial protein [Acinetobacter guerrae]MPW45420.1 fimbrial protein [Acinetobacter guerrae]RKG34260.1 type 1 fimbrial protein [Acinetobacter guerrae]